MCTVREIQEAIREHCQSQHDMESTEIDQVMQRLPFDTTQDVFFPAPCAEAAVFLAQPELSHLTAAVFLKDCGFFHAMNCERSEVNGRFSH